MTILASRICITLSLTGCSKLAEPLGLEAGTITNDKISASSEFDVYHAPRLARLNSQIRPWCAASTDVAAYLQVIWVPVL